MAREVMPSDMDDKRLLVFNKYVDWSVLNEGVTIPLRSQNSLISALGRELKRGQKLPVKVRLNGMTHTVTLTNVKFDEAKYPTHTDIVQLRWNRTSELSNALRKVFANSFSELVRHRTDKSMKAGDKPQIRESIAFLYNWRDQAIDIDYLTADEYQSAIKLISGTPEDVFEYQQNYYQTDPTTGIVRKDAVIKVRNYNRNIIRDLKSLYSHHCQICGICFEKYEIKFSEAHHIDHFVKSLNNDSDNILIVCPNHHRVIHTAKPDFNYIGEFFLYPNGLKERLTLNRHIGK